MKKRHHEIRDPIHTFVRLDSQERTVLDSAPVQRLRHIHQLAMSHLIYPGATHSRLEHSLGVMELAGRVFDVLTKDENRSIRPSIRDCLPPPEEFPYWRQALRMAALCHDVGHLPFSHAAERDLLPDGWDHERLTVQIVQQGDLAKSWEQMTPPLRDLDIIKLAVGPKKCAALVKLGVLPTDARDFSTWETILAEIIVGDAFGVDRMDYLLRDSHHAGVAYGRFDHYRLIDTLRILPKEYEDGSQEPALGVEAGGLHSAESLLLARYLMYTQVYFHPIRKIYDIHLKDFLCEWLKDQRGGKFPTAVDEHLTLTDNEVMAAILNASRTAGSPGHDPARRITKRDHFHLLYQRHPGDLRRNPDAARDIFNAACNEFGRDYLRRDHREAKGEGLDFPVLTDDNRIVSSRVESEVLAGIPPVAFDYVYVEGTKHEEARKWLKDNQDEIIDKLDKEVPDGSMEA